MLMFCLEN